MIKYKKIPKGLGHTLSIFGSFFYLFWGKDCFWFRFFKKAGIHAINSKSKYSYVPFSERIGVRKSFMIGNWSIKILK